jgi:MarR family transcriptional regulator, organic hydroperoxide resistance regulator
VDPLFELAITVKAAQRELEHVTNEAMRPLGVTGPQADAITVIAQSEPLSLKELGELLIAEAGHPSRLVDRLVAAGLVERRPAAEDRRRIELSLTAKGRRLNKRILRVREEIREIALAVLGDREIEPALELLRHMIQVSPLAQVIERRRELFEKEAGSAGSGRGGKRAASR